MFITLVPGGFAEFSEKCRPDVAFLDLLRLEIGGGVTWANVIKLYSVVIYHHSMVITSFCVIKLNYLGNYRGMAVNYCSI